jgi:hypothetical protein
VNRLSGRQRLISLPVTIATLALLWVGATPAAAASSIEGVWSFKGGAVDIQAETNGTLTGVVTSPTKFASCVHPLGEHMWTGMRLQPDGSYWGSHQWFIESSTGQSTCEKNETPGPTAWRVLQNSQGESFVRVCFSEPGTSQPTIAPNGSSADVTWGCVDSASIAPLPVVSAKGGNQTPGHGEIGFRQTVVLPKAKLCVKRNTLSIKLHEPKYDPLEEILIKVNGKKKVDLRGVKKLEKAIVLKHLPNGSYTIKVLAITVLKQRLTGSVKYHACSKSSTGISLRRGGTRTKRHSS